MGPVAAAVVTLSMGAQSPPPAVPARPVAALAVPFVPQRKDTCAAAALAMVLGYWGATVSQDEIAARLLQKELHGILGSRLMQFAREQGFEAFAYKGDGDHLREFVAQGRPLIVAWSAGKGRYHNVVVVGFDATRDALLVNDPARGQARPVPAREFEKRWAGADHWTLLVLPAAR